MRRRIFVVGPDGMKHASSRLVRGPSHVTLTKRRGRDRRGQKLRPIEKQDLDVLQQQQEQIGRPRDDEQAHGPIHDDKGNKGKVSAQRRDDR